jgi:hypothetical protein
MPDRVASLQAVQERVTEETITRHNEDTKETAKKECFSLVFEATTQEIFWQWSGFNIFLKA